LRRSRGRPDESRPAPRAQPFLLGATRQGKGDQWLWLDEDSSLDGPVTGRRSNAPPRWSHVPARARAAAARAHARQKFKRPADPPRSADGVGCGACVNACVIGAGQVGYCGVHRAEGGRLSGSTLGSLDVWRQHTLPRDAVPDE